jgi:carboxymethylenebutenolidase
MKKELTIAQSAMANILNAHVEAEISGDLEATMLTMTEHPHVNHIPTMIGGIGYDAVKTFYESMVPSKTFFPSDMEMVEISQTIDQNQIVLEMIIKFTHNTEIGWMLPGIKPSSKRIEVPLVVIAGIKEGKVSHEHIYWDQASVLVQIGLLNPFGLPVNGIETAKHMETIM